MSMQAVVRSALAAAALAAVAGSARADITVYTDSAEFLAAVSGAVTDTFDDITAGPLNVPLARTAGGISYEVSSSISYLYAIDNPGNAWLTTNASDDEMVFNGFSTGLVGVAGWFQGTDIMGDTVAGAELFATVTDGAGSHTFSLANLGAGAFVGFVSDGTITSFSLMGSDTTGDWAWPTLNDLTLAPTLAPVPEPATHGLMLAGIGLLGLAAARRRRG